MWIRIQLLIRIYNSTYEEVKKNAHLPPILCLNPHEAITDHLEAGWVVLEELVELVPRQGEEKNIMNETNRKQETYMQVITHKNGAPPPPQAIGRIFGWVD